MKGFLAYIIEAMDIKEMGKLYGATTTFVVDKKHKKSETSITRDLKILQRANRVYAGDNPLKLQYIEFQIYGEDGKQELRPYWEKLVVVNDQLHVYEILSGHNQYTKAAIRPVKSIVFAVKG